MIKLFTVFTLILLSACATGYSDNFGYRPNDYRPMTPEERAARIRAQIEYNQAVMNDMNQMNRNVQESLKFFSQ